MTPYHYSVVRCRDAAVHGELRNVGLLVASPAEKKAWLRRASLKQRAHLVGDDADFLDAAFRNTGRMSEVRHYHDGIECLTVATGPTTGVLGPAFRRAITVMNDNGLNVVEPHEDAIETELRRFGLGASERAHA